MIKRIAYLIAILTTAIGLAACGQTDDVVKENPSVNEPKDENPTKPEEPNSEEPEDKVYQNKVFKEVVVTEAADEIIVTGKAQVFEGVFQYALYDGDQLLKENFYQTDGAPAWGEFEITFEKESVTKLELFVYSAKDGSKVDTLEIPISKP